MRIGIIGAGWLGGTVGGGWAKAGHDVLFSSRHPDKLTAMVGELGPHASAGAPAEAAAFGEVVLIATPYGELDKVGHHLGGALQGKIVLDACNPYPPDPEPFRREIETAGVAVSTAKYLPGARLVRVFSAVDATAVEASAAGRGAKLGVPLASDDDDALRVAEQLVRDAGCEPVVVGDLAAARSFQRGGPGFRANTDGATLRRRLGLPNGNRRATGAPSNHSSI
jgi:predicted dinucleotide-binding enzyme